MAARSGKRTGQRRDRQPVFVSDEVPLYYQLGTVLRDMILSGHFAPGEQLATEAELVEEYNVSRITVRQALKLLENEQLIRREVGRGTFVADAIQPTPALRMDGTLDDLISLGMATSVKLLELRRIEATQKDADALQIEPGETLVRCMRVRYYHREPYSLIVNLLPLEVGEGLTKSYLRKGSILQYIEQDQGIHLRDADQSVQAVLADATLAKLLDTRIGAPMLFVHRVVFSEEGQPVEHVRTYYRGDFYALSVHLTRDSERPQTSTGWALRDQQPRAGKGKK